MPITLHSLPLHEPALPAVARWLLDRRPGPAAEDLARLLVLLPSQRACAQLGHALLEAAGARSLLPPPILTPAGLADRLAALVEQPDQAAPPAAVLRPLLLAPTLARLEWLRDRPETAPGLAAELIDLFDEVRLARLDQLVLEGRDDRVLLQAATGGAEEVLQADLRRIREAWRAYRALLPRDHVDRRLAALASAGEAWPGPRPARIVAAHLGRVDRATIDLLQGVAAAGVPVDWLTLAADDPRSALLLATYRDPSSAAHPLHGSGDLVARLGLPRPPAPVFAGADLPERFAALAGARRQLAPGGPLRLLSCRDPEHESRVVAELVCTALAGARDAGRPAPTIVVGTPDRALGARIAAQLRDAGVDVDDSRGRPLASLAAGRMLRDVLRTVLGGWPFAPLLEVLTHPYVRLTPPGARPEHAVRVQVLEAAIRRAARARRGLDALLAIAAQDDLRDGPARGDWSLAVLVRDAAAALAPLADLGAGEVAWTRILGAIEAVWRALAPERPLDGTRAPRGELDDLGALAGLLDLLHEAAATLPPATLGEAAAALGDLMSGPAGEVRPRRRPLLPVRLGGLVEARLESADLLLIAGLGQDAFPGRLERPLLLADPVRRRLELEHWRRKGGRDAELFLRLLHVAPAMVVTWPREREGRPTLPSPLVQRLMLAAPDAAVTAGEPLLRRRALPDPAAALAVETAHGAEPEPIPAPGVPRPVRLSHSAMQYYRECPYRFLMATALGLRRAEPVEAAFTAGDAGTLAHAVMQDWLGESGPGRAALAVGDREAALASLHAAAEAYRQTAAKDLPGSAVALQSLLALAPDLVDLELRRAIEWLPAVLEARFAITLRQVASWLRSADPDGPVPVIPDAAAGVVLTGLIDRIDRRRDGGPLAAVIDYKTGALPSRSRVLDGRELQIFLYALAVEAGAVDGLPAVPGNAWRVDHAAFYGLRRQGLGLPAQPHLSGRDDLVRGVRTILDQALAILDPRLPFALVPDWRDEDASGPLPCRQCEFRGICRLEERVTGPALAARVTALLTEPPRRSP